MLKQMLLPALLVAAGAASAQTAPAPKEVTIPLIGSGNFRTFEATPYGDGVYIQDYRNKWYLARFYARCLDLSYASTIGIKSFSAMALDRGDTIIAGREHCRIASIVSSGPPPAKPKKPKRR